MIKKVGYKLKLPIKYTFQLKIKNVIEVTFYNLIAQHYRSSEERILFVKKDVIKEQSRNHMKF